MDYIHVPWKILEKKQAVMVADVIFLNGLQFIMRVSELFQPNTYTLSTEPIIQKNEKYGAWKSLGKLTCYC